MLLTPMEAGLTKHRERIRNCCVQGQRGYGYQGCVSSKIRGLYVTPSEMPNSPPSLRRVWQTRLVKSALLRRVAGP